jgi:hypothetical protein
VDLPSGSSEANAAAITIAGFGDFNMDEDIQEMGYVG